LAALVVLCVFAWVYLIYLDIRMSGAGPAMAAYMPMNHAWSFADAVSMFVMWAVMMAAMMLPSVSPMVLLYARTVRHRAAMGRVGQPVGLFVIGYCLAWAGFSLAATAGNWGLHRLGFLTSAMGRSSAPIGGTLLILAGLYQWTPLKDACLTRCRSPVGFLADHWREGRLGAIAMGVHHGAYCVGCCWLLMALLFVLGVMNLLWIAVLAGLVLLEKVAPRGALVSRAAGALFVIWGVGLILDA
jgi:predicted metal-binding membrane protein